MAPSFQDSKRYASLYSSPEGPNDARPTGFQIVKDEDLIGKLSDKVVLVTGGSNGIGVDEVKNLARTGARVFFTARNEAKGERVRGEMFSSLNDEQLGFEPRIEVIRMDLESFDSVRSAAEDFKSKSDTLNILVNNAGEYW
jgi:NAD(P)-dependent dehydrogenase (short-subunit alcohol dehydrogenase family)